MIRVTIPGSIRSKKNSRQIVHIGGKNKPRQAKVVPSQAHKKWERRAREYLIWALELDNRKDPLIPSGPVAIKAFCYFKGKRPDLSGALESIGDLLEGLVIQDDTQIESWDGSRVVHDKSNPRIVLEVRGSGV